VPGEEIRADQEAREAYLYKMEASLESKKQILVETESMAVHEKVPKEEATIKTVG
jgi:hypothetical protein